MRARGPRSDLHRLLTLAPLLCAALLCGCSSPPDRTEILVGTTPPGASCILSRLGQPIATVAPTPAIALVDPSAGEIDISCSRQGFADATVALPAPETGGSFGAVMYGRPASDYQRRVDIVLVPRTFGPAPR
jgi:hypothetical protein